MYVMHQYTGLRVAKAYIYAVSLNLEFLSNIGALHDSIQLFVWSVYMKSASNCQTKI